MLNVYYFKYIDYCLLRLCTTVMGMYVDAVLNASLMIKNLSFNNIYVSYKVLSLVRDVPDSHKIFETFLVWARK